MHSAVLIMEFPGNSLLLISVEQYGIISNLQQNRRFWRIKNG